MGPGVSWRLTRAALYQADQPAIARFRGLGNWLISEFRVSSFDRARDAVDFVTATIHSLAGVVENAIFSVNLVDGRAPASGVVFTEDITKIADQQGRYAVWQGLSPLGIECGLRYLDPERLYWLGRGCASPHGRQGSSSVPGTSGQRASKSLSPLRPRCNKFWIRCCGSGQFSAVSK